MTGHIASSQLDMQRESSDHDQGHGSRNSLPEQIIATLKRPK